MTGTASRTTDYVNYRFPPSSWTSLIRGLPGTKDERAIAEAAIAMSSVLGSRSFAEGVKHLVKSSPISGDSV
jgi:hypothetical protein